MMHLFQGAGWILMLRMVLGGGRWGSPLSFAALHAFGLGFVSLAILSVLVHILPAACNIPLGEKLADRGPLAGAILGAILVVTGFGLSNFRYSLAGALFIFGAILFYSVKILLELVRGRKKRDEGSAFLGFMILGSTLFLLFGISTAIVMVHAFVFPPAPAYFPILPPVHAILMIGGWLSLMVTAVFSRTSGPLLGHSVSPGNMRVSWGIMALGLCIGVFGLLFRIRGLWIPGFGTAVFALLLYNGWLLVFIIKRHPFNPAPRRYLISSHFYSLLGGIMLIIFVFWPNVLSEMGIFLVLVLGWLGQFLLAHIYHLGPRLLSILRQGPGDLTPPFALLDKSRTRITFLLYQTGIGVSSCGIMFRGHLPEWIVITGPVAGLAAWISLSIEARKAFIKAGETSSRQRLITPAG